MGLSRVSLIGPPGLCFRFGSLLSPPAWVADFGPPPRPLFSQLLFGALSSSRYYAVLYLFTYALLLNTTLAELGDVELEVGNKSPVGSLW